MRALLIVWLFLQRPGVLAGSAGTVDGGILVCDGAPTTIQVAVAPAPGARNVAFGDSFTEGAITSAPNLSFVALVAGATGWPLEHNGLRGKQIQDIVGDRIYPTVVVAGSHFTTLTGLNDVRYRGMDATALGTYRRTLQAGLAWLAIPNPRKLLADDAAVDYAGVWGKVVLYRGTIPGRYSGTAGARATVHLRGTAIYVGYSSRAAMGNGGSFSVAVDGVNRATVDTSVGVNSASPLSPVWPEVARVGGLTPGMHTVQLTVISTGAKYVNLDWFGSNEAIKGERPPLVLSGTTPRLTAAGYAASAATGYAHASDAAVALYNQVQGEVCAELRGDGLGVFRVDVSTDYDPNVVGNVSGDQIHPNDAGHQCLANAFLRGVSESARIWRGEGIEVETAPARVQISSQANDGKVSVAADRITYTPGANYLGADRFSYEVAFPLTAAGLPAGLHPSAPFTVAMTVRNSQVMTRVAAVKGAPVAGLADATLAALRTREAGPVLVTLRLKNARVPAIGGPNGAILLKAGDPAPGLEEAKIATLGAPSGRAVIARMKIDAPHGVTGANDTVLLAGLTEGNLRIAAREGQEFSNLPGVAINSFVAFDGNGSTAFFVATLRGPGVTPHSDTALCAALADGRTRVVVREGQKIDGKAVVTIGTMVGIAPTLAEGRWRVDDETFGVRLGLSDGRRIIFKVPATAESPAEWTEMLALGDLVAGEKIAGWGWPGFGPGGVVVRVVLSRAGAASEPAIVSSTDAETVLMASAAAGVPGADETPISGARFVSFCDPVRGAGRRLAFFGSVAGRGITSANGTGLWFSTEPSGPRLIARLGDAAVGGGRWTSFRSLVLPNGVSSGPIFTGTVRLTKEDGVAAKSGAGLWAVDSKNTLRLVLRTGQQIQFPQGPKTVLNFDAASSPSGSVGSAHGSDDTGCLAVVVTFDDGSSALVEIGIP